ncbi:glycerol-3-phosphate dehydrogenase [Bowmanella sp. JS7-9]|uniref:Glycerol-3-phosphate dehydrogenase n=1 Tax=Pseudobowmanella zhangzhouensis TaxID=1537679 RepID=A0ABW1XHR9_9ALTE|nr:glycerol-3-phosphate dehydrogenase [Bowmanella sp. JS7-9]TBX21377.1 glycerol-3-phosphate dehydrogenase [Bowmanella sp. JS7-9]
MVIAEHYDLIVVGGGVNGTGIAADAASRGLKVLLCEQNDLGSATSSRSSKLIHGGLRYLEHHEFSLVRKALAEREVLLKNAPHIMHPLRFVLPHQSHLRPAWLIRLGLFLYDNLASRATLPGSRSVRFDANSPLKATISKGFTYSDVWVDDARLVILNAKAAEQHGATIINYCRCTHIDQHDNQWRVSLQPQHGQSFQVTSDALVNAAGPWVSSLFGDIDNYQAPQQIRLVKGSHIIVPKIHDGDEAYILQNPDGRIIFVSPFEQAYSLVGTTDVEYAGPPNDAAISQQEIDYLINSANHYFKHQITANDIVSTYSGVRPLMNDESVEAQKVTRDYTVVQNWQNSQLPLISAFGGKITTYRKLAEAVVDTLKPKFPAMTACRTQSMPLPGGDFTDRDTLLAALCQDYGFVPKPTLARYVRQFGTDTRQLLLNCMQLIDLGQDFGCGLYQKEVDYLVQQEWASCAEDILWRRTKLGLQLSEEQQQSLSNYLAMFELPITTAKSVVNL